MRLRSKIFYGPVYGFPSKAAHPWAGFHHRGPHHSRMDRECGVQSNLDDRGASGKANGGCRRSAAKEVVIIQGEDHPTAASRLIAPLAHLPAIVTLWLAASARVG